MSIFTNKYFVSYNLYAPLGGIGQMFLPMIDSSMHNYLSILKQEIYSNYWICNPKTMNGELIAVESYEDEKENNISSKKKRPLELDQINFDEKVSKLLEVLDSIIQGYKILIKGNAKLAQTTMKINNKRSNFIGVVKQDAKFQAHIAIKKKKTYIGTYLNEIYAAVAYDFYLILLKSFTAKPNFNYSKFQIVEMIQNYIINGSKLNPAMLSFINSIN